MHDITWEHELSGEKDSNHWSQNESKYEVYSIVYNGSYIKI